MSEHEQAALAVMDNEPERAPLSMRQAVSAEAIVHQQRIIQEVVDKVMRETEHYGVIPGTNKPTLLKAGAEILCVTFRLAPEIERVVDNEGNGHRTFTSTARLRSIDSGMVVATGHGICSTMETKYRFRKAEQTCPECGQPAIIKGKKEYDGGWVCFAKKGGCGAKFEDGDPAIENQNMGRVEHDNPADYWNTCGKMADKRALIAATLNATACSNRFTQDVEDMPEETRPRQQAPARTGTRTQGADPGDAASEAQLKLIRGICERQGIDEQTLTNICAKEFDASDWKGITKRQASALIDQLQPKKGG